MADVAVLILPPEPAPRAGELERWVAAARAGLAERHRVGFLAAGATGVKVWAGLPDGVPFGERLRSFVASRRPGGLVVLGSGAIPLATSADRRAFVAAAGSRDGRLALVNNRFSADVLAIATAANLADLPGLASDNTLPRWLGETPGYQVVDLRNRWQLGVDIDGPGDLVLIGPRAWLPDPPASAVDRLADRLPALRPVA